MPSERRARLEELAGVIDSHVDWWRFPEEGPIRGFLGTDPLFIVGDQPSTSPWDSSHPNRRAFYALLNRLAVPNAHVTDLYKRRGSSGALKKGLPDDFKAHVEFFREEVEILQPFRVVALGGHAHQLLAAHVPELVPILTEMWHFSYVVRYGRTFEWRENARLAIFGTAFVPRDRINPRRPAQRLLERGTLAAGGRPVSQRNVMRRLFVECDSDEERVIAAYAHAERSGEVVRSSRSSQLSAEAYARALFKDGLRKGWLT